MGALHYGNVSIRREGSTVSCLVDGSVVGTLVIELAEGTRGLSLPFSSDHTFWLGAGEANALFDVEEAPVEEAAVEEAPVAEEVAETSSAEVAEEAPLAEEPVAEVAAPAATSRRGRRRI